MYFLKNCNGWQTLAFGGGKKIHRNQKENLNKSTQETKKKSQQRTNKRKGRKHPTKRKGIQPKEKSTKAKAKVVKEFLYF